MLEAGRFYFGPGPTTIYTIDPVNGERKIPVYPTRSGPPG